MHNCAIDENGLKHVILCRVLVENEEIPKELNSEVDDVVSPSEYVVWTYENTKFILMGSFCHLDKNATLRDINLTKMKIPNLF